MGYTLHRGSLPRKAVVLCRALHLSVVSRSEGSDRKRTSWDRSVHVIAIYTRRTTRWGPLRSPRICRARLFVRVEALSSRRRRSQCEEGHHTNALEYFRLDLGP